MQAIGKYRWTICGLVFFATTINYLDRAVISLLKETFTTDLGWNDADYANVEIAFKIAYAVWPMTHPALPVPKPALHLHRCEYNRIRPAIISFAFWVLHKT